MAWTDGHISAVSGLPPDWDIARTSASAFQRLEHLSEFYPGFCEWYHGKVIPGLLAQDRKIFLRLHGNKILGVAIAKRGIEQKLCTLWVADEARAIGVASCLAQEAFDWIGTNKPLFTVPEERLSEFRGLLCRWEFQSAAEVAGYYRNEKVEYVFNGTLRPGVMS